MSTIWRNRLPPGQETGDKNRFKQLKAAKRMKRPTKDRRQPLPPALISIYRTQSSPTKSTILVYQPNKHMNGVREAVNHKYFILSVGTYVLLHPGLTNDYLDQVNALLVVQHFGELYGERFISYNVQCRTPRRGCQETLGA